MRPSLRAHSKLKKIRMTPGRRHNVIVKERQNKSKLVCASCGKQIHDKRRNKCNACSTALLKVKIRDGII